MLKRINKVRAGIELKLSHLVKLLGERVKDLCPQGKRTDFHQRRILIVW